MNVKVDESQNQKEEILSSSQASINKKIEGKLERLDTAPLIPSKIGKGEDAKNSIIWTIITWSLAIPTVITLLYFITMWAVYFNNLNIPQEAALIRQEILKVWGIFIPIITLALGYLYGKSTSNEDKCKCIEDKSP